MKGRQIWPPPWAAKGPATPLASRPAKDKTLEQKRFFAQGWRFPRQSPIVMDGTFELDYASVIFFDPGVQLDET